MAGDVEPRDVHIPDATLNQWQKMVDVMAELAGIPAGLIMRLKENDIEVFMASHTKDNPYTPGDREHFAGSGLYCETVINTQRLLHVPDALSDPEWEKNPDVKLNMISYLGLPIRFPDQTPFGTICILDSKPNQYSKTIRHLLESFQSIIESHLELLYMNYVLGEEKRRLSDYVQEIQTLRGLIPICAQCKKIKDSSGYWFQVEKYLAQHTQANFTHALCPECYQAYMDVFEETERQKEADREP